VHRGMTLQSGCVRPIDYDFMSLDEAASMGLLTPGSVRRGGTRSTLAVVRCVDERGERLTAIGVARHFRALLASGEASEPCGVVLSKKEFPVVLPGWQPALLDEGGESAVA
jgi:hypothetical protein